MVPRAASDRYHIDARTDTTTSREQMMLMIQTLLQDRFQLVLHKESRNVSVYHLVAESKDGSKLQPSKRELHRAELQRGSNT